ncbi:CdaR family transcriptional regulator [Paenibacillus cymbidii]|uniref:CdaR family transcriptional regulator n=1 Tax=Paenibacillus cymbidii TaxID=1639034 RepID=UPI00107FEF86|nr:sugar diacid recognition domain-containing protein [Paenibacillus cymbidii]
MLTEPLAQSIVRETMARLRYNINIVDESGTIIASGDPERVGNKHEGGLAAMRSRAPLVVTAENEADWPGCKRGINLPLEFGGAIVGAIGITGDPEAVAAIGDFVKLTTELMMRQEQLLAQKEWRQRTMEAIAEELMRGEPDWPAIERRLGMLQVRPQPPFDVLLAAFPAAVEPARREEFARRLREAAAGGSEEMALSAWYAADRLLLVIGGALQREAAKRPELAAAAAERLMRGCRVGSTAQAAGLHDVPAAIRECEWALRLGAAYRPLAVYADVATQALVRQLAPALGRRFAERVLKRLPDKLDESMQALFDNDLNVAEASQALGVHRNTLLYRLAGIKETTGFDPKRFHDAVALQLAIWLREQEEE